MTLLHRPRPAPGPNGDRARPLVLEPATREACRQIVRNAALTCMFWDDRHLAAVVFELRAADLDAAVREGEI